LNQFSNFVIFKQEFLLFNYS